VLLLLAESPEWVAHLIERFHYLGPAAILFLCGLGLPLPEEVTLIACGLLLYEGKVAFLPITVVCSLAILAGDTIPYLLGRRYGLKALENRWVARVLHPERFALVEGKFHKHGSWVVFMCRFLPGIRIPAYFTAGTLGMGYPRFLVLDALGVLISVPTSIAIAEFFGGKVQRMQEELENFHLILAFALFAVIAIVVVRMLHRRRQRQVEALAKGERGQECGD